jgi:hydroxypyruvate isomerase
VLDDIATLLAWGIEEVRCARGAQVLRRSRLAGAGHGHQEEGEEGEAEQPEREDHDRDDIPELGHYAP